MKSLLKEPLLHFAVIGVLLFVLYAVVNPDEGIDDTTVVVDSGTVASLQAHFERIWNRPPSHSELKGLVDEYVVEEVFYRQALSMGMDQNDPMIRRRLRQKMEVLTTDALDLYQPTDAELEQFLENHPQSFAVDPVFSFQQIYLSTDAGEQILTAKVESVARQLGSGEADEIRGDASLLPRTMDRVTAFHIDRTFGEGFSEQLARQEQGLWSEPFASTLGVHFVKVTEYTPGHLPPLAQVREAVTREWQYARNAEVKTALIEDLRAQYEVVVEWPQAYAKSSGD